MKNYLSISVVFLVLIVVTSGKPSKGPRACGYDACPKADAAALNVHIVPHSHDDVGWLKTVDQYYYGSKTKIQSAGVQYIIDSMVSALTENPERKFVQVETAFLHKWWKEQTQKKRDQILELVNNGQLEVIGGAWSMNDEAASHYHSLIDQFTFGLRVLEDILGQCARPKIGWQIDPFGHSKEMASIFARLGYDGVFFARLDYRDKMARLDTKSAEMLWQGSANLGDTTNIFTSVLYNFYMAPNGYCFDILCSDTPVIDDPKSTEYNYEIRVQGFADFISEQAAFYTTNNIIILMGGDFNYQDAHYYFKNLDKLIAGFKLFEHSHDGRKMNVFYSSPACYTKAVNDAAAAASLPFKLKKDDFFPYASDPHTYWTGYFTSRPTSKRYERQAHNLLTIAKQIATFSQHDSDDIPEITLLQEAVGIMQHHDAITGTEKQHVADDYAKIITDAIGATTSKVNEFLSILLSASIPMDLKLTNCLLANSSICTESNANEFNVLVYNPLSQAVDHIVRLPVDGTNFVITGSATENVDYQIVSSISEFSHMTEEHRSKFDLVFLADSLPPLGLKIYHVLKTGTNMNKEPKACLGSGRLDIGDSTLGFVIDDVTGLLSEIIVEGTSLPVSQSLMYYIGAQGNNIASDNRSSGAYIFRPSPDQPEALPFTGSIKNVVYQGAIVEEVHQEFGPWAKQIVRVYKGAKSVEIDWLVGPIDKSDGESREIISRFKTSLNSGDTFYTDSNGREMLKRVRNFRATYNYTNEEPVSGNYYPVTSKITLKDTTANLQFSVLNDRAQGGGSLKSGEVELMLHRRLLKDDAFGVNEALDEEQYGIGLVARGQLYLTVATIPKAAAIEKELAQAKALSPWTFVTTASIANAQRQFTLMQEALPKNVHILTLEPWRIADKSILLRLEHIFEKDEDSQLSLPVNVDLDRLFISHIIGTVQEMTLGANQLLSESQRLSWIVGEDLGNYGNDFNKPNIIKTNTLPSARATISLAPMEIKTLILTVTRK